ncbi:MAG: hypothetical protein M1838_004999 [Thelocarpon superellum]|nr:MAG: hypothetical protein M1838_004999 [Thelocarpon superellum]
MPDAEDKEKAEKLAAAKKRVEQLKKQKGKKAGPEKKSDKPTTTADQGTNSSDVKETKNGGPAPNQEAEPEQAEKAEEEKSGTHAKDGGNDKVSTPHKTTPSLSLQSRMRSTSFRRGSGSQIPLSPTLRSPTLASMSPEGDAVTDIYRKQARRIDELESDNKRMEKDMAETERRWRKTEAEVEELREAQAELAILKDRASKAEGTEETMDKLRLEIASLQRQNAHLQSHSSRSSRHASSPSQTALPSAVSEMEDMLGSKSRTIESMETEISNLRAQLGRHASSSTAHHEQVAALEEKLERSDKTADLAQRQLVDLKKSHDRTSERAVRESSQRTSAETQVRTLERELDASKKTVDELSHKCDALEKKNHTLAALHKESDGRSHARSREHEKVEKEMSELKKKSALMDNEILQLREEKERLKTKQADGADDDGLDELEDEERAKLKSRIRELEGEVFELKKGVWKEKRKELESDEGGSKFDDIDLGAPQSPRRSVLSRGQGLSNVLTDGLSALTGRGGPLSLVADDEDFAFDEDAFRQAQEQEGRRRVERVKEIKRGLKEWEGWRLDLVESRAGGGGIGEIFEV